MISAADFQELLANSMFSGDLAIAGIVMYVAVLAIIFSIFYKTYHVALIISIPLTLVFTLLEILPTEAMVLMIVIAVLILAMGAKKTFGD